MSTKVVINNCYGGFGLSLKALELVESITGKEFDSYTHPRHCAALVRAVETLGEEANGRCANLIIEVIEGNKYIIREYDGQEWIQVPEDVKWVEV